MISLLCVLILSASPVPSAAGPRTGEVSVVTITVSDTSARDAIIDGGYDVSNVQGRCLTLYATEDELQQLRDEGYSPITVTEVREKAYHGYDDIVETLQSAAADYPAICSLQRIGTSEMGRGLWAILVTDNPGVEEDEPEFKYVGGVHGDEPVGIEMCLKFLNLITANYGTDDSITALVDSMAIWILPSMNPDGLESGERYNANGYDLNRSFPEYPTDFADTVYSGIAPDYDSLQPEVAAVMKWTLENSFVLSANFHGGSLVVNYPYDDDSLPSGVDAPSPDDGLFQDIARRYSIHNTPMWNSTEFPDGITNGNAWYRVTGGMQDWNYRYAGCNEVTIELSNTKRPAVSTLPALWSNNEESMLAYAEACQIGVRGIVLDAAAQKPLWAEVRVDGIDHPVYTDSGAGDYHRMLLPGTYTLEFAAHGCIAKIVENVEVAGDTPVRVDVQLARPDLNNDGVIDAVDVQTMINTILGLDTGYPCDLDGGGVSSTDLQILINAVLGVVQVEE